MKTMKQETAPATAALRELRAAHHDAMALLVAEHDKERKAYEDHIFTLKRQLEMLHRPPEQPPIPTPESMPSAPAPQLFWGLLAVSLDMDDYFELPDGTEVKCCASQEEVANGFQWTAMIDFQDNTTDCYVAHGSTAQRAIDDLRQQLIMAGVRNLAAFNCGLKL